MKLYWLVIIFAISTVLALPTQAADAIIAAVPASSDSEVWFGNALKVVLMACAAPVAAILSGMLWRLASKFGIEASAADQRKLNDELKAALTLGAVKAEDMIAQKGWDHIDVHSIVVKEALDYFLQRFPERAAAIAQQAGAASPAAAQEAVADTLMSRLPAAMTEAAASPATPPAPIPVTVVVPTEQAS